MAAKFDLDDVILNYDPEKPATRFQTADLEAATAELSDRLPHPLPWPHSPPIAVPLDPAPKERDSLARFMGYDAVVMTWTAAEAAALAALFTPNHLPSQWYEYRHGVEDYIPLVTGSRAPFNDKRSDMARYYHSLGLYFACRVGKAKVLLFKSGLHLDYDGPAYPLKRLVNEITATVKPKIFITTGTGGGVGKSTALGDIAMGPDVHFDCTTQFKGEKWARAEYRTAPVSSAALDAITPQLLRVNASRLPGSPTPTVWHGTDGTIVTTDFFGFDDSTDHFKLQGKGRICEMGDAMVGQALQSFADLKWYAIRNASDPQIPNPSNDIDAANKSAGQIYTRYGSFTTAGSAIATWAVLSAGQQ
jgi:nucleoside phosphorylase